MRQNSQHRSGFAMATAMCIVAVAGVAMAAVGALLASDVHRTLNAGADVQLRQLLIAAEIDAPSHLSDSTRKRWTTALPPFVAADAELETRRVPSTGGVNLEVMARLAGRSLSENLHYDHQTDGWKLTGAELFAPSSVR